MALPQRDQEQTPVPLASLFGNDVQAWKQDQIKLSNDIQRLIAHVHAENTFDWNHILASIVTYLQKYPSSYRNSAEDVQPSLEIDPNDNLVRYGISEFLF